MASVALQRIAFGVVWAMGAAPLHAQVGVGTWVQQSGPRAAALTMTVEACCNGGRRLIYRITGRSDVLLTVDSPMDGSDAQVMAGGKPTGETMAITRVDDRHALTVLKMNGQRFGTSRATLSPDGRTLTIENDITSAAAGQSIGKRTDIWVRK